MLNWWLLAKAQMVTFLQQLKLLSCIWCKLDENLSLWAFPQIQCLQISLSVRTLIPSSLSMSFFMWCLFWWVWEFVLSAALNSPPSNSLFPTITILPMILKWHKVSLERKQLSLLLSCAAVAENNFREMFGTYQTFNSFFWCHLLLMNISTGTVPSPTASKFPLAV